ncbi:calpain-A isoform X2 [Cryptotermes secundus]|uniref:calpain-A isoform X2 n=1 Tax=Cryptotermes secundus TaxID=105785 RepID=UPI001454E169|nr:calpain-A isoform X2 [Cryptotermes secundus]
MNINRGITNITITTKRRGVLYKRTQSDETNENCIPATYGIPISRCCGSVPIKTAPKLGEKGSGLRARGQVQDFFKIRDQCLEEGTLFEDPEFPAEDSSIYFSKTPPRPIEWKRPMEIADNPELFVEGASRFDVQQGELGDCWLLAAVANLTLNRALFSQVVPDDQSFGDKYAGIFHFRFWQYGRWVDVVIDDRLPTYGGRLVFLHSSEHNEFWSALLEKAYAKLHGSYEALKGGTTCEAMEDFTGGVTEMYELNQAPPNLYRIMLKAYERSSLMGCSIEPDPNVVEAQTPEGLIKGHAYSVTKVKYVDIQTPRSSGKIPLIRIRNPWGNEAEWNGPWSDKSPEWRFIPDEEKEEIGLTFDEDGEFWMSYKDFQKHFSRLEICNLNPDSLTEEELLRSHKRKWEMSMFECEWVRGVTAGGCRNYLETFWHNPQYRITLEDPDEEDDDNKCTVIVALMQKNHRSQRKMGIECLTIGFAMYHLKDPDNLPKPLDLNFFKYNASVARSQSFINLREVSCRFKLPPGVYCIVPSTFEPNEEGEFILRVFSEHKNHMEENDEEVGLGKVDDRVVKQPEPEEEKTQDKVKEFFCKIAGEDMEIDWMELKEILDYAMRNELPGRSSSQDSIVNTILSVLCGVLCRDTPLGQTFETKKEGFSKDVCRSMVAMMDVDRSGKLGFEEFKALWVDIRHWKAVFKLYDKDDSGCLSAFELRQALNSAGYRLNNHILNILAHRYSTKNGMITFDDFMMCAVRLKTMIDIFREKDTDNTNTATFTMEEWVEKTLYS